MKHAVLLTMLSLTIGLSACDSQQADPTINADNETTINNQDLQPSKPLSGEQLFIACQACHNLADGAEHKVGPNLFGIIDQPAASRESYTYSDALKNSGLVWNKSTLTGWVLATENVVSGTWMIYHNHLSPEEVVRLVDYIATQ